MCGNSPDAPLSTDRCSAVYTRPDAIADHPAADFSGFDIVDEDRFTEPQSGRTLLSLCRLGNRRAVEDHPERIPIVTAIVGEHPQYFNLHRRRRGRSNARTPAGS